MGAFPLALETPRPLLGSAHSQCGTLILGSQRSRDVKADGHSLKTPGRSPTNSSPCREVVTEVHSGARAASEEKLRNRSVWKPGLRRLSSCLGQDARAEKSPEHMKRSPPTELSAHPEQEAKAKTEL